MKHHAFVYSPGKRRFQARCRKCKWKGTQRRLFLRAWLDAREHDPEFPRGDKSLP